MQRTELARDDCAAVRAEAALPEAGTPTATRAAAHASRLLQLILLRGSHETPEVNELQGFRQELFTKYKVRRL